MLQIASGKFFGEGERYEHEAKGILYSNLRWIDSIETTVGTLEPVETFNTEVSSWVFSYVNRIEKGPAGGIVRVGDEEIVAQFSWLCMIFFQAFFDGDRQSVIINCRENPAHASDRYVGATFAKPFLNPDRRIHRKEDTEEFARFVKKVIGLPRRDYLSVMGFLQTISHSLHSLRHNFDLAYSMLIYALEALSAKRSNYVPQWEDYDQKVKKRMDSILEVVEDEMASQIRSALLKDTHLKLRKQFNDFAVSHLPDSFFVEDAQDVIRPLRRSELEQALGNAYNARSKYVHELRPVIEHLKLIGIAEGEVFHSEDEKYQTEPHFTFNGLLRLCRKVLLDFVEQQPFDEKEDYYWVAELPGLVTMKWSPEQWIGNPDLYSTDLSAKWLSEFLTIWLPTATGKESRIPDLSSLLSEFEALLTSGSNDSQRAQMVLIHVLYNYIMDPHLQTNDHEKIYAENAPLFDECRIESLIMKLLLADDWPWAADECAKVYGAYAAQKFHKKGLILPQALEVALMISIAGKYRQASQQECYEHWHHRALLDSVGQPEWQTHILAIRDECKDADLNIVFGTNESEPQGEDSAPAGEEDYNA